eukprot:SAG31_NODE_29949_length_387_cov_1.371528_1_plen_41_part_10
MYGISKHFHYWHRASMRGCERAAAAALLQVRNFAFCAVLES